MTTNFHPGDRVHAHIEGFLDMDFGLGTVTARHEGINLQYSIKLDDSGDTATFPRQHVSAAS